MKRSPAAPVMLLILSGLFAGGCSSGGNSVRTDPTTATRQSANIFDRQQERERYVDDNTSRLEKSGRFANEKEARIYAGYEWDRYEQHKISAPSSTTTWSSRDAEARKQEKLAADLDRLDQN